MTTKNFLLATVIIISLLLSVSVPLLTYSVSLAVFGLMHVARELHYVDLRFNSRMKRPMVISLCVILFLIVMIRGVSIFKLMPKLWAINGELLLVFLLALLPQFFLQDASLHARLSCGLIALLIGLGFVVSPSGTIVLLAVLHNLTPMGFIVEAVSPEHKKRAFFFCSLLFILLPLLIASGLFHALLAFLPEQSNLTIFATGPLEKHLGVFLPASLQQMPWATQAFSAVVFAQCLHYLAVIYFMPRLLSDKKDQTPLVSWPQKRIFWLITVASTCILVLMYANNFFFARAFYGIAAALHAYIEIPILLWVYALMTHEKTLPQESNANA